MVALGEIPGGNKRSFARAEGLTMTDPPQRQRINVRTALVLFPILVLLGIPVMLFWEYPRWPATSTGWLFVCTATIPLFIVGLASEVLLGADPTEHRRTAPVFSFRRAVKLLFWLLVTCAYFYLFEHLFPELRTVHLVAR